MIEKPANVRLAAPDDEEAVYLLLTTLHRENPLGYPFNSSVVLEWIKKGCRGEGGMIGIIETADEQPRRRNTAPSISGMRTQPLSGSAGLFLDKVSWYSDVDCLRELWLYVPVFARFGRKLYDDLFMFSLWAREDMLRRIKEENPNYPHKFPLLTGPVSRERLDAKARLWRRYCGEPRGMIFAVD